AAVHFPMQVGPLARLMATVFVTFAVVAVGVVGAFECDALAFERRDAVVLGPLPVPLRTIVAAKLAALGRPDFVAFATLLVWLAAAAAALDSAGEVLGSRSPLEPPELAPEEGCIAVLDFGAVARQAQVES